jgi:hypothetical protein
VTTVDWRTSLRNYNMHICRDVHCDRDGWPIVRPSHSVPDRLTKLFISDTGRFDRKRRKEGYLHFFVDDYKFERLWNHPERYVEAIRKYDGMIAPDFSTWRDMSQQQQRYNVYRSRVLTMYYQQQGIDVIPLLQWSDGRSWKWCFDGLPRGGTLCAPAHIGFGSDRWAHRLYVMGLAEAYHRLEPDTLLFYGEEFDVDLPCDVVWYENEDLVRGRAPERERRRRERESRGG